MKSKAYIIAELSPADEEHLDEYIAREIFGFNGRDDILAYSQALSDAIKVYQMIGLSIPCGFEISTHPAALKEALFSYKGRTVYANGDSLPFVICAAGLIFYREMKKNGMIAD